MKQFSKKAVMDVAGQFCNMIYNNLIQNNGSEPFLGWLADGEVFDIKGLTEEEIEERMEFAKTIADKIDAVSYEFDKQLNHPELL